MFTNIICRTPGPSIVNGQSTVDLGNPIFEKALEQHKEYMEVMKSTGVNVTLFEADNRFPDSCFVEDPAVVTKDFAIITNPGHKTRNGEKDIMDRDMKASGLFDHFDYITDGELDGGDVMQIDKHFYIGLSTRTNKSGAEQFIKIINKYGYTGEIVKLDKMFHLKSGVNFIGDNTLLVAGEFKNNPIFDKFKKLDIFDDEMYAANCVRMNDWVVMPANFPKTKQMLLDNGFKIKEVNTSEFQKVDGGLSCLSVRF